MERNKIDDCTTNECPDVTPEQLLAEKPTEDDCLAVDRCLSRFNSTTGFLNALAVVLLDLEAFGECGLLNKFTPIMARIESAGMNGDPTTIRVEGSDKELHLVENNPRKEDSIPRYLQLAHDFLGAPPSPNGE